MSNVITKDALAKIAISKNLIKEYKSSESDRTVYLNDGTEFQIYLKNPFQNHLGIKIYVNNKSIGNMLVLRPGESFWLDRFVNENSKFLFSTYQVEDTDEMRYAINNNGKVKIEFFHEREKTYKFDPSIYVKTFGDNDRWLKYDYDNTITCGEKTIGNSVNTNYYHTITTQGLNLDSTASTTSLSSITKNISNKKLNYNINKNLSLETGRVEKGGISEQKFETCDIDFDYYPFNVETILILPNSRKQIRVEETMRKYCSQCGKKVRPKDKFCSNCGAKLN